MTEPTVTETTITEPGIYDIPSAAYHALPHLSRSTIHTLLTKSPAHAKMGGDVESTDPMKLGTVAHALLLGKGDEYAESPFDEYRTNEAKAWKAEQLAAGITPIKSKDLDIARAMADRCREQIGHHEIGDIFERPGNAEVTVIWQEKNGVVCRCRIDWTPEDIHALYDYKTKASASADDFQKSAFRDGDYLQAHFYPRGVAKILGLDASMIPFRYIVQESFEPYFVNIMEMSGETLEMAEDQIEQAIRVWGQCETSGKWPDYGKTIGGRHQIDPPGYMVSRHQMQKATHMGKGLAA